MIYNVTLNDYRKVCKFRTGYILLLVILFIIITDISSGFFLFSLVLKKDNTNTITNAYTNTETVIY